MANAIIKITNLPNIGNSLSTTSIFPVVANVNQTDKVALGDMGNLILTEAGNTLEPAFLSTLAYGVTNAAQPNITSVGTLTSLSVSANANVGNLNVAGNITDTTGNLAISTVANGNISLTANGTGQIILDGMKWPLTDGVANNVLKTDGAGNLSWVAQVETNYGNSNVANYLPTYTGNLSPSNLTVTTNSLLGNRSTSGSYFVYRSNTQISIGQVAAQTIDISGNGIQIAGTGGVSLQGAANANIVIGGGTTGNVVFPDGITFNDGSYQNTAYTGANITSDRLVNGNVEAVLDSSGTLTMPLVLPTSFVAVLNSAHCTTSITLTGTPWQYSVQFQVNPDGTVQTVMNNPFPQQLNPGYTSGKIFRFVEADHGIPGYTFDITLNNVVQAGPAGWTANPSVSQAPVYPSTFASDGAIKITADANSFVFGTDGTITYPDGTSTDGASITTLITNSYDINTSILESVSAPCYIANGAQFVADIENNDDITVVDVGWTVGVGSNTYTVTAIDPSPPANQYRITAAGATFVTSTTYTFTNPTALTYAWSFGANGTLTLPGSGTISQNNNDLLVQVAGTDIIGLRTEGGDVIVDAAGNLNIPGELISTTSVSRLSLNEQGGGGAYLTSTDDDSTALFLRTSDVQLYAGVNQTITAGTILPSLETVYTDSREMLDIEFTGNELEPGYPWGITLPVSYLTYDQLIQLSPGTFTNQTAVTVIANNTKNAYQVWQDAISETNVTITANENSWVFSNNGNLILAGNLIATSSSPQPIINGFTFNNYNGQIRAQGNSFLIIGNTHPTSGDGYDIAINGGLGNGSGNSNGNVTITTANVNTWRFDPAGNLTLPTNSSSINYANGQPYGAGGGGNSSALVNGGNSFVLDSDGSVTFQGATPGQGVDRGLVWDYGANANGVNSMVRQDANGITVRAYTELGGGANGYSAPVNIITNQDANTNTWRFDGQGNLTLAGNLNIPTGNIVSNIVAPAFNSGITSIDVTGNANVTITISNEVFGSEVSGQVTISNVNAPTQSNGNWWYQAIDYDRFQLYTDANLTTPVDGSSWPGYAGPGGDALGIGAYSNLTIQGGNVSINSNDNTWVFDTTGNLTVPSDGSITAINEGGQLGSQIFLNSNLGQTRMSARSTQYTENFDATSWSNAEYTSTQVNFTDAPNLLNFVANNSTFTYGVDTTFSINGGNTRLPYIGYGGTGSNVIIYTDVTASPDPTTVTSITFYYQIQSYFGVNYDSGRVDVNATGLTIYIENDKTQGPDINLRSGDDITLQGKDKALGTESEGGDINIYAGDGAGDDGTGNFASSGGDIQIIAGVGGFGNSSSGSGGGFARFQAGDGGDAGVSSVAGQGGYVQINAGAGGYPLGNGQLGALGGYVEISAGTTTLANSNGGDVTITSGYPGDNAYAGNVQIITPTGGLGLGGTWTFDGNGNLSLPRGGIVHETSIPSGGLSGNTIALKPSGGTNADQQLLVYPTTGNDNNHLHLTSGNLFNTELFLGDDNFFVKLANTGNIVINTNDNAGNTYQLNITPFGEVLTTGDLFLQTPNGVPNGVTAITGSTGSWESNPRTNLATTNGTGAGLTVTVTETGGYASSIAIVNPGSGYANGDEIAVTSGSSVATFTISVSNNQWTLDTAGNLTLPTITLGTDLDEQAIVSSQRKLIPPLRYSAVIDGSTPTVVYNATNVDTTSMKVTMQVQHAGLGMEFFEVFATFTGSNTYYTVGNRVSPPTIDASTIVVGLGSGSTMKITVTINSGATTSWVTYDAVEFGIAVD